MLPCHRGRRCGSARRPARTWRRRRRFRPSGGFGEAFRQAFQDGERIPDRIAWFSFDEDSSKLAEQRILRPSAAERQPNRESGKPLEWRLIASPDATHNGDDASPTHSAGGASRHTQAPERGRPVSPPPRSPSPCAIHSADDASPTHSADGSSRHTQAPASDRLAWHRQRQAWGGLKPAPPRTRPTPQSSKPQ